MGPNTHEILGDSVRPSSVMGPNAHDIPRGSVKPASAMYPNAHDMPRGSVKRSLAMGPSVRRAGSATAETPDLSTREHHLFVAPSEVID
jgi:hypothetical protein